jgi:uncharacterized protein YgiM (DUF1202 family)
MQIDKEQLKQIILKEIKQNLSEQWKHTPCVIGGKCYATSIHTAVRAGTTGRDEIITYLKMGTEFEVIGKRGGWWNILLGDGKKGWVAKSRTTAKLKSREQHLQGMGRAARGSGRGAVSFTSGTRG